MKQIKGKKSICRNEDSIWLATTPGTDYPSLPLNKKIDVDTVVIGGGIAGISTALFLKQAGVNVALIEADRIVKGVSGYTSGKITSQHILIYRYLIDEFGFEMAKQYADANQAAIEKIAGLIKTGSIDCDFFRKTAYTYAETDETMENVLVEAEAAKSLGLPAYIEEKVPIPIPVKGAVCFCRQAQFHPRKYLLRLAEMIPGNGSMVFEKTRATGIKEYGRKGFLINTTAADVEAKNVVIATNFPFYDKPGQYYARMEAGRIYSFAMKLNTGFPDGIFISAGKDIYSFRSQPYRDGELIIAGGQEHVTGKVEDTMARFVKLFKYVKQYYDVDHIEFCWSSQDNNTFDMVPYIGRYLPDGKNIYIATGFNGWGMTHGTISAMIITDMILGVKNPWSGIYDPARFKLRADKAGRSSGFEKTGTPASSEKTDPYDKIKKIQNLNEYLKDLDPGDGKIAEISGTKVALYKHIDGDGYFLSPLCPHMGCLLRFNGAEKSWDCPCHGSRFSFDGKVLNSPAFEDLEIFQYYKKLRKDLKIKTATINQTVVITGASPHDLYEILMDSKKHAKLVNSTAEISRKTGGKFKVYDGYINGTNIELIADTKIVQYWRGDEDCWPENHYSKLTITFKKEKDGTRVSLNQEEVPVECQENFDKGWYDFYWEPLQQLFEKK